VIYRRFGVHGRQFGSGVNGFQLQTSDIDISVLLPRSVQEEVLADAHRQRAEAGATGEVKAEDPSWGFLASKRPMQAACVAAVRLLGLSLREEIDLHVVEVVESARVPIIKCKYRCDGGEIGTDSGEKDPAKASDKQEFEVDISFCNEVAYFNSRLLRSYADFDGRVVAVCLLVKLWAKRRKINSPFDGTLSSYAYSLLVIHYLQRRGVLPNLQCPRAVVLEALSLQETPQRLLDGGHDVWFVDPAEVRRARAPEGQGDAEAEKFPPAAFGEPCEAREAKWWLGNETPRSGVSDLLYGFFRYFALELNPYSTVVSVRFSEAKTLKVDYFLAQGSEMVDEEGAEAEVEVEEEPVVEEIRGASPMPSPMASPTIAPEHAGQPGDLELTPSLSPEMIPIAEGCGLEPLSELELGTAEDVRRRTSSSDSLGEWDDNGRGRLDSSLSIDAGGGAGLVRLTSEPVVERCAVEAEEPASTPLADDEHIGVVKTFSADNGFGFIACEATFALYQRDVFLHQKQAAGVDVGDRVRFAVELNGRGQPQARQVRKATREESKIMDSAVAAQGDPRPALARAAVAAQKRLKDRQCLCIDDPFERHRTLGATFNGQALLTYELRRALSILKKGGKKAVELLFKEKEEGSNPQHFSKVREFSPIPHQETVWEENGPSSTSVQLERVIKKEVVGKVIGASGSTIKQIREESGVEEARIYDNHRVGESYLLVKGEPDRVHRALALVEQVIDGSGSSARLKSKGAASELRESRDAARHSKTGYPHVPTPLTSTGTPGTSPSNGNSSALRAERESLSGPVSTGPVSSNPLLSSQPTSQKFVSPLSTTPTASSGRETLADKLGPQSTVLSMTRGAHPGHDRTHSGADLDLKLQEQALRQQQAPPAQRESESLFSGSLFGFEESQARSVEQKMLSGEVLEARLQEQAEKTGRWSKAAKARSASDLEVHLQEQAAVQQGRVKVRSADPVVLSGADLDAQLQQKASDGAAAAAGAKELKVRMMVEEPKAGSAGVFSLADLEAQMRKKAVAVEPESGKSDGPPETQSSKAGKKGAAKASSGSAASEATVGVPPPSTNFLDEPEPGSGGSQKKGKKANKIHKEESGEASKKQEEQKQQPLHQQKLQQPQQQKQQQKQEQQPQQKQQQQPPQQQKQQQPLQQQKQQKQQQPPQPQPPQQQKQSKQQEPQQPQQPSQKQQQKQQPQQPQQPPQQKDKPQKQPKDKDKQQKQAASIQFQ